MPVGIKPLPSLFELTLDRCVGNYFSLEMHETLSAIAAAATDSCLLRVIV